MRVFRTNLTFGDPAPDGRLVACCLEGPLLLFFPCDGEESVCSEVMVLLAARAARATTLGPPRMALMASATNRVLQVSHVYSVVRSGLHR